MFGDRTLPSTGYTLIDLFAGCGGLTRGFLQASRQHGSFRTKVAVEKDVAAAATYAANFGEHVEVRDIDDWARGHIPHADVVIGGPPCQGFSALGIQDPTDPRNDLWLQYAKVVQKARPRYFVIENVPQFLTSSQFALLEKQTIDCRGPLAEYRLEPHVLTASKFGSAQHRRRAIIIGRRADLPPVGKPRERRPTTVRAALGQVKSQSPPRTTELPDREIVFAGERLPGKFRTTELHITRKYTPLSLERFSYIPEGGNRKNLPVKLQAKCWRRHHTGAGDVMGRLRWDEPSVTIRTEFFKPEKGRYLHPEEDRAITHMEAALLQGFPSDYWWCGTKISIARQIGNAVPVQLAAAIADHLLGALANG